MKKLVGLLVVLMFLGSLGAVPAFQGGYAKAESGQILAMSIDSSRFPDVVLVHVSVDVPYTLTKTAFEIYENGEKQRITNFDYTGGRSFVAPVDLVFIIDRSGSMGDDISDIKNNAYKLAEDLKSSGVDARFALVTFGLNPDDARIDLPFTDDVSKLKQALDSIVINGGIEWSFDGIMEAFKLNFRPTAQKVFIVVTDEDDQSQSKYTVEEVANKVKSEGVFLVLVYNHNDGYRLSLLSQAVGALDMDILDARQKGFSDVLQRITTTIGQQYHITYSPTNKNMDGSEREVKVVVHLPDGSTLEATGSYVAPTEEKKRYELTPDEEVVYEILKEIDEWFATTNVQCNPSVLIGVFKDTWENPKAPYVPNLDLHTMMLDPAQILQDSGCFPPKPPRGDTVSKDRLKDFIEYFTNINEDKIVLKDITIVRQQSLDEYLIQGPNTNFYVKFGKYSANIFKDDSPQGLILNYVDRYFISTMKDSQNEFRDYKRFVQRISFGPSIYGGMSANLGLPPYLRRFLNINIKGGYEAAGKLKEFNPTVLTSGLGQNLPEPEAALYGGISFEADIPYLGKNLGKSEFAVEVGSEAEGTLFTWEMVPLATTYIGTTVTCALPGSPTWLCGVAVPAFIATTTSINNPDLEVYVEVKGTKSTQASWSPLGPLQPPSYYAFGSLKFFVQMGPDKKPGISVSAGVGTQIEAEIPVPSVPILYGTLEAGFRLPLSIELVDPPVTESPIGKVQYFRDYAEDVNGNDYYEALKLSFNITTDTSGKYHLTPTLLINGSLATAQGFDVALHKGANIVTLNISGQYIYYTNHTGPFEVGLIIQDKNGTLVYYNFSLGKTKSYDYRQFEHVVPEFDFKYVPLDVDGDGKYDEVQINVTEVHGWKGFTVTPMLTGNGWIIYLNATNMISPTYTITIDGMHVRKLMGNFTFLMHVTNITNGIYLGSYRWRISENPLKFESEYPTIEKAIPISFNYKPAVMFTINVPKESNITISTKYEVGDTTYSAGGYFGNVTPGIHNLTVFLDESPFVMHNTRNATILSATLVSNGLTTDSVMINKEASFFLLPRGRIWNVTQIINATTKLLNTTIEVMSYENTNATIAVTFSSGNVTLADFMYPEMRRSVILEIPVVFNLSEAISNLSKQGTLTVIMYNQEGELLALEELSVDLSALLPMSLPSAREDTYTSVITLSRLWTHWFFKYFDEFNELYVNATEMGIDNETLQKALELHNNATNLIKDAWRADDLESIRNNLWRGSIILPIPKFWEIRKAYLLEKQAIEILRNAIKNEE